MRWLHPEYLLKGIFLGLLLFVALLEPTPAGTAWVAGWLVGGFAAGLLAGAARHLRAGARPGGKPTAFLLFVLLESPQAIYAGTVLGLAVGAFTLRTAGGPDLPGGLTRERLLLATAGGGAVLGLLIGLLRQLRPARVRLVAGLLAGSAGAAAALWWLSGTDVAAQRALGVHILLGLPFFYLLTFVGENEESEAEIAALCASMAVAAWLTHAMPTLPALALIVPLGLYVVYATRILPGLRVFKHTLRGYSYYRMGRLKPALVSLRRAQQLDPRNTLAREVLWRVHLSVDLAALAADRETMELLDVNVCLDRAAALLAAKPTADQLLQARRLLDLVATRRPDLLPLAEYWRAVADTHAGHTAEAAERLGKLLDPAAWPAGDVVRASALYRAWALALTGPARLTGRLGTAHLREPGRRMEAIAAVEAVLAGDPADDEAVALKRLAYSELTEAEFLAAGAVPAEGFGYDYVLEMGRALIDDPARWRRGAELLRVAVRGNPVMGPTVYTSIADAAARAGDSDGEREYLRRARDAGQTAGVPALPPAEREAYFAAVRRIAEDAARSGDLGEAIQHWHLYTDSERSGIDTLRTLADLYERRGDALGALRATDQALLYNKSDADLLERKGRYYNSVEPAQIAAASDKVKAGIDVAYCLEKGKAALDRGANDAETLDWAGRLAGVALAAGPDNLAARFLAARVALRLGRRDDALRMLEDVREATPSGAAEREAWDACNKLLGQLYLDEYGQPDLAIACLNDFKASDKSGADTYFNLGRAYEAKGDAQRAKKCYEHVTAYKNHPLYWQATDAVRRLDGA